MPTRLFVLISMLVFTSSAHAEEIPVDSDRWEIEARTWTVEDYNGKKAIKLERGKMTLTDTEFGDGTIRFLMSVPAARGFSGLLFHIREDTAEEFYVRHHLSGKPDATQYTPAFGDFSGWQLYHGPQYSFPLKFKPDVWLPVKFVVKGGQADIYLGNMEEPAYAVTLKSGARYGRVALYSNVAPARFADFEIEPDSGESLRGTPVPYAETPGSRVQTWQVSSPFPEKDMAQGADFPENLTWTALKAEENGVTNLARVTSNGRDANMVLARFRMTVNSAQIVPIQFGYSDRVQVFVNGVRLYSGNNGYRSRDYRYLGTIGLFDTIHAPLIAGENTITFAVAESFGGWGIVADVGDHSHSIIDVE